MFKKLALLAAVAIGSASAQTYKKVTTLDAAAAAAGRRSAARQPPLSGDRSVVGADE